MSTHELDALFGPMSPEDALEADIALLSMRFLAIADKIMEETDMTKKTLAAAVGTSPSYITQLFRGDKILNLEMIVKIQNALGIAFVIETADTVRQASRPEAIANTDVFNLESTWISPRSDFAPDLNLVA